MICMYPSKQSKQYMTQAALLFHEMYHQHFIIISYMEVLCVVFAVCLNLELCYHSKWYEDYSNSTFHNPITVLLSSVERWHDSPSGKTKACHHLLDYPDAKCDLGPFRIRYLLLDDKLGMQSVIHCQKRM